MSTTLAACLIVAAAGLLTGLTGFGFSVLSVPLLVLLIKPQQVVVIALILVPVTSLVLLLTPGHRGKFRVRTVVALTAFSALGLPIGLVLFEYFDPDLILGLMGLTLIAYALYGLLAKARAALDHVWLAPSGFLGGILATSTGLSGPAVAMYVHGRRLSSIEQLTTMSAYVGATSVLGIALLAARGGITGHELALSAKLAPIAAAGTLIGIGTGRRWAARSERVLDWVTLVALGLMGSWTAVRVLVSLTTNGDLS